MPSGTGTTPASSLCECGAPRCEREGCQDKPTPTPSTPLFTARRDTPLGAALEQLRWMAQWVGALRKRYGSDRPPDFMEPIQPDEAAALLGAYDRLQEIAERAAEFVAPFTGSYSCGCCPGVASFMVRYEDCDCGCHETARECIALREALDRFEPRWERATRA